MKEIINYALVLAAIAIVLLFAAEQGSVVGTGISDRMVRFIKMDF